MDPFIDPVWLNLIRGKILFYPASGNDTSPFIDAFTPYVTDFHFNDLIYTSAHDEAFVASERFEVIQSLEPPRELRDAPVKLSLRCWRNLEPSVLIQYLRGEGINLTVRRRRGFGQYALQELPERSIGVFVHRQDSMGDGGSNMWFLANRRKRHEPLSNLWEKLSLRLADSAIVVSDGSLTNFKFLQSAALAKQDDTLSIYSQGGFTWQQIGNFPTGSYRRTLVWGLKRQT